MNSRVIHDNFLLASIVVPAFNYEIFLSEASDSILNQD